MTSDICAPGDESTDPSSITEAEHNQFANELLNHGGPRLVYGAALVENVHEYLLGIEGRPKYIVPPREGAAGTRRDADQRRLFEE